MYNNFKLFRWNNPNIHISHDNCLYANNILHTGTVKNREWQNSICLTNINNSLKIIPNSNHFINGFEWPE
jgi:hypothetical protein